MGKSISKNVYLENIKPSQPTLKNIVNKDREGFFASLKKGMQISGLITSVTDQILINLGGHEVSVKRDMIKDAIPGQEKMFEVKSITDKTVELRLLGADSIINKGLLTVIKLEKDFKTFFTQLESVDKQKEKEKEYQEKQNKIDEVVDRMTERDYAELEREGYAIDKLSVEELYEEVKRNKQQPEYSEVNSVKIINSFNHLDQLKEYIESKLREANFPVSKEIIKKVEDAMEHSETITKMNGATFSHLIDNNLEPTIGNVYKAYYSGNEHTQSALSNQVWEELKEKVNELIKDSGYDINEENLEKAKWLIKNELPLTQESYIYLHELEELKSSYDKEIVLNQIISGMIEGKMPLDISLKQLSLEKYEKMIDNVTRVKDNTISKAIHHGMDLTIRKLANLQKEMEHDNNIKEIESRQIAKNQLDTSYQEIKAKRQLEEIRLKMTLEAARSLENKGIHIETERIEKIVEALRELEDQYYVDYLKNADIEPDRINVDVLKETTQSIETLKRIPNSILGATLSERRVHTVSSLLSEGQKLQANLEKAQVAYETLMSVPNPEYGDSIHKAFQNVEHLLNELDLEDTLANQKAIRILGYNGMEITKESIQQVKAYDRKVTSLCENLHPSITVRLMKEGMNPLNVPIDKLNKTISEMKEEMGPTVQEKFSTYLWRLEKEEGLSEHERKAYIGIYRLLYNIDKTDGAALGAVIKADREVTLNNLLTAVRTLQKGTLDTIINDEFGTLEKITLKGENISDQLNQVFKRGETSNQSNETYNIQEQTEYLQSILKRVMENISPANIEEIIIGQKDQGIWNFIKNISLEKLYENLLEVETSNSLMEEYSEKLDSLKQVLKSSEQANRFLSDFQIPSTTTNLLLATQLLSDGGDLYKKLNRYMKDRKNENTLDSLKEMNELSDKLISREKAKDAYEQLEEVVVSALEKECSTEPIDFQKLLQINSISAQLTLAKMLASKEFYQVPIVTEEGITNINLTVIRGAKHPGKVSVSVFSEKLGRIKAEFSIKDYGIKGYISSDNRNGLESIKKSAKEFIEILNENKIEVKHLDFSIQSKGMDTYSYTEKEEAESTNNIHTSTERVLYQVAKASIHLVQAAEKTFYE